MPFSEKDDDIVESAFGAEKCHFFFFFEFVAQKSLFNIQKQLKVEVGHCFKCPISR